MQKHEAAAKREAWGDKPCDHPKLEREYFLGMDTGTKVCVQCGQANPPVAAPAKDS